MTQNNEDKIKTLDRLNNRMNILEKEIINNKKELNKLNKLKDEINRRKEKLYNEMENKRINIFKYNDTYQLKEELIKGMNSKGGR